MSATAICQNPSPIGTKKGVIHLPITAPKLAVISVEKPWGPKFSSAQMIRVARKMVVPAFSR